MQDDSSSVSLVAKMADPYRDYVFPECYSGEESEAKLIVSLKLAALLEGFSLVIASRIMPEKMAERFSNSERRLSIRLECEHHRVRRTSNRQTNRRVTSRKGNTRDECCPFCFTIYLKDDTAHYLPGRWFLSRASHAKAPIAGRHSSHYRLDTEDIRASSLLMTNENRELAKQSSQLHFASSHTAALLALRDEFGIAWDSRQISYLTRKERQQQSFLNESASSAENLIASFDQRDDVSYCMVSYDRLDGLVLLQKKSRKKVPLPTIEEAAELHRTCGFSDHERLMLIFLFASDEEFRLLSMHPEILACDTTFGVERSKKGMFTIAGVDGNNQAFNCGRAYIPNEQTWVFQLLFNHALPRFWGSSICRRVHRFITDGCPQEYGTLIRASGDGRAFEKALHSLCFYHLVVQKWAIKFPRQNDAGDQKLLDQSYLVLWDWAYYVETHNEYNYSRDCFFAWMQDMVSSGSCTPLIASHVKKYILESLDPYGPLWLGQYRGTTCSMGKRTSNLAEVMHRSIKAGPYAVNARQGTAESALVQMDKAEYLGRLKKRSNARAALARKQYALDTVSHELTKYAEQLSFGEWSSASSFLCVAITKTLYVVFTRQPETSENGGARCRFLRARLVNVARGFAACSCKFPAEYRMPCRHMFRVLGYRDISMFGIRWHIAFQHCYRRPAFKEASETMRQLLIQESKRDFQRGEQIMCPRSPVFNDDQHFPTILNRPEVGAQVMTEELMELGLVRFQYLTQGKLLVRGKTLPQVDGEAPLVGMDVEISHSAAVTEMLSQDLLSLQKEQEDAVEKRQVIRKDAYGAMLLDISKSLIKMSEESPALRKECMDDMMALQRKYIERINKRSERDESDTPVYRFEPSTKYSVRNVKRKGL